MPRLIAVFLATLAPALTFALDPSRAITQYVHRAWRTEDGLPQTSATAIAQTNDGYLWIGTRGGLARFDGVRFVVFDKENTPQLRDSEIDALLVDHAGTLWIGTSAGLTSYRDGRFQTFGPSGGVQNDIIYAIVETRDGRLWVGGSGVAYERGADAVFRAHKLPLAGNVLAIAECDGAVWIGMGKGLVRLAGEGSRVFTTADGLPNDDVISLAEVDGDLWIGTTNGVARWHAGALHTDVPPKLRNAEVWSILADADHTLWFGTRNGLMRLRGGNVDVLNAATGLSNDYVSTLFEDRERNLWVGTQLGGINELRDGAVTTYSMTEGLPADTVWSLFDDGKGNMWIGTEKGIARVAQGHVAPIESNRELSSSTICAMAQTSDGALWIGTYQSGVFRLRHHQWKRFTTRDGLPTDSVDALFAEGLSVWAGTSDGVCRIDGDHITKLPPEHLPSPFVNAIHRDRRGRLWVATAKGVAIITPRGDVIRSVGGTALPQAPAFCFHEDGNGAIWVGTHDGLLHIDPYDHVNVMTTRHGLVLNEIRHIQQDAGGNFWIACARGVFRVTPSELERGRISSSLLLGSADGFKAASECTYGTQGGSVAASDGSIWFATTQGAARLDPAKALYHRATPHPRIETMIANGKTQPTDRPIELAAGTEGLEFHYTAPSFVAPHRIRFRYRLDGYDNDWIDAGTRRVAYYTHIPPGSYRFRVTAYDNPWSSQQSIAEVPFSLRPRYSETIWFRLQWALLAIVIAMGVYAVRVRGLRAKYAAVLAERNRIAREFHDTLAQSFVGLGFQLDTAIDSLGDAPEQEEARRALADARKLARQCLSEARRSLLDLRPEVLENTDLASAIAGVADQMAKASGIAITSAVGGGPRRLEGRIEQHLLRIAQEALTNAIRHSGAQKIDVSLYFGDVAIELSIVDDGTGPRSMADSGPLRLGFIGIRERAAQIGGHLTVASGPRGGTSVVITVPTGERRPTLATRILAWGGWR